MIGEFVSTKQHIQELLFSRECVNYSDFLVFNMIFSKICQSVVSFVQKKICAISQTAQGFISGNRATRQSFII